MKTNIHNPAEYKVKEEAIFQEVDYLLFEKKATRLLQEYHDGLSQQQWDLFCKNMRQWNEKKPEKLMLLQAAFHCFNNNHQSSTALAQFITLASHVKSVCGVGVYRDILEAPVPATQRRIEHYLTVFQLLVELHEEEGIVELVEQALPDLVNLFGSLFSIQNQQMAKKYPKRDIDTVLENFAREDALMKFPLKMEALLRLKSDYVTIESQLSMMPILSSDALKDLFLKRGSSFRMGDIAAKPILIAISAEMIRRFYKILPYDTQILALLAILDKPDPTLKGRIAQIKTGEGKSTIFAMLAAFMAGQGYFVDITTSSPYLAIRDCEKYAPFFQALGLSASHICYERQQPVHFQAQILYGTNSYFEFALLKDGLNKEQLRYSYTLSDKTLIPRIQEVKLIDEVDNMLLDGNGAARMAIPGYEDVSWVYKPMLEFVNEIIKNKPCYDIHAYIFRKVYRLTDRISKVKLFSELQKISDAQLNRWIKSAQIATYEKQELRDYVVEEDIEIIDYEDTGRRLKGCQWPEGIHQLLQAKHDLPITCESLTAASIAHPTYYGGYQILFGLTGTMGELVEREEVQEIYGVDSFDVPQHRLSQRQYLSPRLCADAETQTEALFQNVLDMQKAGRPILVLFESIFESIAFSKFLRSKGIVHQLLNTQQRESEDYIIARAGESMSVTVATNTAGRGTDIIVSPKSLSVGGLHQVFAFYPKNLRVSDQGFGRAGRQGQPGSCCMILNIEDKRIQSLLVSTTNPLLLDQWQKSTTDADRVVCLNQIRSEKIQVESGRRRYSSKLEGLYFACLQGFFSHLRKLHLQLDDKTIQNQLRAICESGYESACPVVNTALSVSEEDPTWKVVYRVAEVLLINQSQGKPVDWTCSIDQFCSSYIEQLLRVWSVFYSKLPDLAVDTDIAKTELKIREAFSTLNLAEWFQMDTVTNSLGLMLQKIAKQHSIEASKSEAKPMEHSEVILAPHAAMPISTRPPLEVKTSEPAARASHWNHLPSRDTSSSSLTAPSSSSLFVTGTLTARQQIIEPQLPIDKSQDSKNETLTIRCGQTNLGGTG